jgi:hypothetical protein
MNDVDHIQVRHLNAIGGRSHDPPDVYAVRRGKLILRRDGLTHDRAARAFTIVELLVTISVMAILMGLLLPAIGRARIAGRMTNEMAAARELMLGYILYTDDHKDRLMPGYKEGLPAVDQYGVPLEESAPSVVAARYPWRIAPYLGYNFRGLYKNEHEHVLEEMEYTSHENYVYVVSLSPSLGINATWIGGDQNELGFNPTALEVYGRFYITRMTEARFPERLLVFTSARGLDPLGVASGGIVQGYFKVTSPRFSASGEYRWTEYFRQAVEPGDYGFVSLRYHGCAVTTFVDGHVGMLGEEDLKDMRHWANMADEKDWGLEPNDEDPDPPAAVGAVPR